MHHCTRSIALLLLLGGCVLEPDVIGEGLSTDSGPVSAGSTTDGMHATISASTAATDVTHTTAAPEAGEYGGPCELVDVADPVEAKAVSLQPDCAGDVCVFMFEDTPPQCSDDSDCPDPWPTCGAAQCVLDQDFVAESTRCTEICEDDAECPAIPGCASGEACVAVTSLGPLCCTKICLCRDDFSVGVAEQLGQMCQQPGFCDP